jgi:uncharacterized protein YgiM (DUF1202 family)
MDRKKRNTIAITALSVLALAGIGWFIYDKIKIKKLNSQLSTPEEMEQKIDDNLSDIPDGPIEETPVDPDLLPNMNFDDNGNPIESQNDSEDLSFVYTKSGARLRSEPSTNSTILDTFEEGEVFFVIDTSDESDGLWYSVDDLAGVSGWFRNDVVTK